MNFVADSLKWVTSRFLLILLLLYPTLAWAGIDPVELLVTPQMVAAIAASYVIVASEKFLWEFNREPDIEINIDDE